MGLGHVPNTMLQSLELQSSELVGPPATVTAHATVAELRQTLVVRVNHPGSWPDDPDNRGAIKPRPLGRRDVPPQTAEQHGGLQPVYEFLKNLPKGMAIGEDTFAATVAAIAAVMLRVLSGRVLRSTNVKVEMTPQAAELWEKFVTQLNRVAPDLNILATGALASTAYENFKQWLLAAARGDYEKAKGFFDGMVASLIGFGAVVAPNLALRRSPVGKSTLSDEHTIDAKGGVVPDASVNHGGAVTTAESNLAAKIDPKLPAAANPNSLAPTGELSRHFGPVIQGWMPLLDAVRRGIPPRLMEETGAVPASPFGKRNLTTNLIKLKKQWRRFPEKRLENLDITLNRELQNKYPGIPEVDLKPATDSSIPYHQPFDQRTFIVPVDTSVALDNQFHRYFGYVRERAEQSWLVANYMAKVLHQSASEMERHFPHRVVAAVLRNPDPMNPEHETKAKALFDMGEGALEQEAREAGDKAEEQYWAAQPPRRWWSTFDLLRGFGD